MAKIKTADLIGPALDWAVANCLGYQTHKDAILDGQLMEGWFISGHHTSPNYWMPLDLFTPSTNPAQGQPILEREGICLKSENRDHSVWSAQFAYCRQVLRWPRAELVFSYCLQRGPTMLIAGLRCFVASRLGDVVDVPDELLA